MEHSLYKLSARNFHVLEALEKNKAVIREGWAPLFIFCAQDTMGFYPPLSLQLLGYWKPLPFKALVGSCFSDLHYLKYRDSLQFFLNFSLTLKAPNKHCSRQHFNFLLLYLEENEA